MSELDSNTTASRIYAWMLAIEQVERCEAAIQQYEALGISGTQHDIEHRKMRNDALAIAKELRP